jgi:hypothetical protein
MVSLLFTATGLLVNQWIVRRTLIAMHYLVINLDHLKKLTYWVIFVSNTNKQKLLLCHTGKNSQYTCIEWAQ